MCARNCHNIDRSPRATPVLPPGGGGGGLELVNVRMNLNTHLDNELLEPVDFRFQDSSYFLVFVGVMQ